MATSLLVLRGLKRFFVLFLANKILITDIRESKPKLTFRHLSRRARKTQNLPKLSNKGKRFDARTSLAGMRKFYY